MFKVRTVAKTVCTHFFSFIIIYHRHQMGKAIKLTINSNSRRMLTVEVINFSRVTVILLLVNTFRAIGKIVTC